MAMMLICLFFKNKYSEPASRIIKKLVNDEGYTIRGVRKYLSNKKISYIKKEGAIKISEELDMKLDNIEQYLKKAKSVLGNEK